MISKYNDHMTPARDPKQCLLPTLLSEGSYEAPGSFDVTKYYQFTMCAVATPVLSRGNESECRQTL